MRCEKERKVAGARSGRVVRWERRARVNYVNCRTGKGNLQSWRAKLDDMVDPICRKVRKTCGDWQARSLGLSTWRGDWRRWSSWEEIDEREKWAKKMKKDQGGRIYSGPG